MFHYRNKLSTSPDARNMDKLADDSDDGVGRVDIDSCGGLPVADGAGDGWADGVGFVADDFDGVDVDDDELCAVKHYPR